MHRLMRSRVQLSASEALRPTCSTGTVYRASGWMRSFAGQVSAIF